jgi:hypothetical protein
MSKASAEMNRLASRIAKDEGLKSETNIGNIREILRIIVDISVDYLNGDDITFFPGDIFLERALEKKGKRKKPRKAK